MNSKNPPRVGSCSQSTPILKLWFPCMMDRSSLNCHFFWNDCCGTLPLVPNVTPEAKVTVGTFKVESITLFQYWYPTVAALTIVGEITELKFALARIRRLVVKFPAVRSFWDPDWSFRPLFC